MSRHYPMVSPFFFPQCRTGSSYKSPSSCRISTLELAICPQYSYRSQHYIPHIILHINSLSLNNSSQFQASKAGLRKVNGLPTVFNSVQYIQQLCELDCVRVLYRKGNILQSPSQTLSSTSTIHTYRSFTYIHAFYVQIA
jgi:hypothetical protein